MITIKAPVKTVRGNRALLESEIIFDDGCIDAWVEQASLVLKVPGYHRLYQKPAGNFTLWFAVAKEYAPYLCSERSDAFLVAILYFAMLTGEDIKCEAPLTEQLYYQLTDHLIPTLCNEKTGFRRINIVSAVTGERYRTAGEVGTGASCGVDSLSTILLHTRNDLPASFKLTYLTSFNVGAFNQFWEEYLSGISLEEWNRKARSEFEAKINDGQGLAAELGLQFLSVDTNMSDLYQGAFLNSHTYRHCAPVLALQGLWSIYYYASAGKPQAREQASLRGAVVFYDELLLSCISTPTLSFYSGGFPYPRIEKTRMLLDYAPARKYLNVCQYSKNCGRCGKCMGTILTLDILGALKDFESLFAGMGMARAKKWRCLSWVLDARKSDLYADELYRYMQRHHLKFPLRSIIYHRLYFLRRWLSNIPRKRSPKI